MLRQSVKGQAIMFSQTADLIRGLEGTPTICGSNSGAPVKDAYAARERVRSRAKSDINGVVELEEHH